MSFARLGEILRSTSFRIAVGYTVLFLASFAALGFAVHEIAVNAVRREVVAIVASEVTRLARVHERFGVPGLAAATSGQAPSIGGETIRFLVVDGVGRAIAGDLPTAVLGRQGAFLVTTEENGEPVRLVGAGLRVDDGTYIAAGQSDVAAARTSKAIRDAFFIASGIAAAVALLGGVAVSRAALGRIARIHATTRQIMTGDLSARVPLRGANDEIDRLTQSINGMLERIQTLMGDLRHVTVDIAHDLRTPLGRLRQQLEEAQESMTSAEQFRGVNEAAISEIDRLLDVFAGLMRIAEIESKARREAFAPFDVSALLVDLGETYAAVAEEAGHRFALEVPPGVMLTGDRALVAQAAANLIENALRHTPAGTRIVLGLQADDRQVRFSVTDDGPGIPADQREDVLKPFHRLDPSRTASGNGLGLALVKAIAGLHEASVSLSNASPGLTVALTFPRQILG
ncbi:sensor histidine kinase [Chthonobacter albigriseus]|uniref:sensor histidine kinase n=1 Tax=Chthonobacter albigriseus TaxID=1683161 RepID=UPI0015EEA084|nr:HAMP domain-containing sensor histidine kinase [Chthonobacter albigriseus]